MNIHDQSHPIENGTPAKSHQQFSAELNKFLFDAAGQGVGLEILILELEIAKLFIFQRINQQAIVMAQQAAKKNAPAIITPRN
jgi:hypothetical protein